jgi:hypothetical protein
MLFAMNPWGSWGPIEDEAVLKRNFRSTGRAVVAWLPRGCHVVVGWSHRCLMVVKWLSHGCHVVVAWLLCGCHMAVVWL